MTRLFRCLLISCGLVLAVGAPAGAKTSIPDRGNTALHDQAGTLTSETRDQIENDLEDYNRRTSNALAVLIVKTTGDQSIEDYSNDVARKWGLGQKGKNNGVLFVLAMSDHHGRIEVATGLQGQLTDVAAKQILDTQVFPRLKANDPNEAVRAGEEAIRAALGDTQVTAPTPQAPAKEDSAPWFTIPLIIGFILLCVVGSIFGRRNGGGPGGFFFGGGGGWASGGGGGGGFGGFGGGGGGFDGGGASGSW